MRTILTCVERTLLGWSGDNHFFASSLLPFSVLTPLPSVSGFLLALLSADYWGFRDAHSDPSLPYRNIQGVKTGAQRGDLHSTM